MSTNEHFVVAVEYFCLIVMGVQTKNVSQKEDLFEEYFIFIQIQLIKYDKFIQNIRTQKYFTLNCRCLLKTTIYKPQQKEQIVL